MGGAVGGDDARLSRCLSLPSREREERGVVFFSSRGEGTMPRARTERVEARRDREVVRVEDLSKSFFFRGRFCFLFRDARARALSRKGGHGSRRRVESRQSLEGGADVAQELGVAEVVERCGNARASLGARFFTNESLRVFFRKRETHRCR